MKEKFLDPRKDKDFNAVDYFNMHRTWEDVFENIKGIEWLTNKTICNTTARQLSFEIKNELLHVVGDNQLGLVSGKKYTKFMALSRIKFKGNHTAAFSFVNFKYLNAEVPYIRVGTDYLKIINKSDRYGVERKIIKGWKKEEIKQDHGAELLKHIHRFDDFCIVPNNTDFNLVVNNCYNLYAPFSHQPVTGNVTPSEIPVSMGLMNHIFGEQIDMGLVFLKVLYLHPQRALPILCLVSSERQTGKTTFLNWMQMIFGDNYVQINPEDITSSFNSAYATKNIVALDETVIDKSHAVEKIKSLATTKSISVNQKFVANYSIPFFGKIIICTNKEKDFMRIDEEEIRFWVRKVKSIEKINTKIENQLKNEIPKFLKFVADGPEIDFSRSRMVFTPQEIQNDSLKIVQKESWSWLKKEIYILINEFFNTNSGLKTFQCTAVDMKNEWFLKQNNVTMGYIFKVLSDEMGLKTSKMCRYTPFNGDPAARKSGKPFTFNVSDFEIDVEQLVEIEEIPF